MSRDLRLHLDTPEGAHDLHFANAPAEPLSSLLAARGFPLNTRCGGRGLCSGCECELLSGRVLEGASRAVVDVARGQARIVRTCQCQAPGGEMALAVPARSLLKHKPEVVSQFRIGVPWGLNPLGDGARLGAAVDVGTTTVALLLCDLTTGEVRGTASAFNAQIRFGEDVLTRIEACSTDKSRIKAMQQAISTETIQPLLAEACEKAGATVSDVGVMTVAANTTMLHLLAGVDPSPLGVHPFRAVFLDHRTFAPGELGLDFGSNGTRLHLLPSPAAYVGADIAAGIVATGMLYEEKPTILVDVGTNGEIVARFGDRLVGCATAAGPAFEGAGLLSGMRAVRGVIERVRLSGPPLRADLEMIGDETQPLGICGSAYVDFLTEGRSVGLLEPGGRFASRFIEADPSRFDTGRYGWNLKLHPRGHSGPIRISELDVARLLQAKAAIAAGIQTMLELIGCKPRDIHKLHLAGGFGMHLSLEHAIGCGLLHGFSPEQIEVVGNTSLAGAMLALADRSLLAEFSAACERLENIELNQQPGFEDAYIDHLTLP